MLYVCAWSAKNSNLACKQLYDRLVQKDKCKKMQLIAVLNQLIKQAFAIAKSGKMYPPVGKKIFVFKHSSFRAKRGICMLRSK